MSAGFPSLLTDRLVFVTGKGGTGKTTCAAAIARVLAAKGRRTLLCEVDAQRPALQPIFGVNPGFTPVNVERNLDVCNLIWPDVLGAWMKRMVRIGWVVDAILANDLVRRFLDFTPGAQDLVEVSAIDDLVERYDVVVVDMPASGHAFSLLDITRSALQLFRAGPVRQRATELRQRIADPTTTVVMVALPEDMVVNESLETLERLRKAELVGGEPLVILNRATRPMFDDAMRTLLERVEDRVQDPVDRELAWAGRWRLIAEDASRSAEERLGAATRGGVAVVPALGVGARSRDVVGQVSQHLGRLVGLSEVPWT